MNNNEYLLNQEIKNRRLLLKMYKKQEKKILAQLTTAFLEERSTKYLESLYYDLKEEIRTLDMFFAEYAKRQTKEAYLNGVKQADYQFRQLTLFDGSALTAFAFGKVNKEAVSILAKETYTPLNKLTKTLARDCKEYLSRENFKDTNKALETLGKFCDSETMRKVGLQSVEGVVFGNETWKQAMNKGRDELIAKGALEVPYYKKDGTLARMVKTEDYCKMVARTTTAKIMREGTKDRIKEVWGDNGDLVEVIGHSSFPNSPCIPYEDKILSLDGDTPQEIIDKCGDRYAGLMADAEANHLFHCNCIHTFGVSDFIASLYEESA